LFIQPEDGLQSSNMSPIINY